MEVSYCCIEHTHTYTRTITYTILVLQFNIFPIDLIQTKPKPNQIDSKRIQIYSSIIKLLNLHLQMIDQLFHSYIARMSEHNHDVVSEVYLCGMKCVKLKSNAQYFV